MLSLSYLRIIPVTLMLVLVISPAFGEVNLQFGSKVQPHDLDLSVALSPFYIGPEFAFVDAGIVGVFDPRDPVYINIDPSDNSVSENDVRLTQFGDFAAGAKVKITDADHGYKLSKFGSYGFAAAELRYFDVDGDKAYSLVDPVYLDLMPGKVTANDIRLTGYKEYAPGSRVRNSDLDSDKPTMTLPGMLSFYNANGNINNGGRAIYDDDDVVYMDTQYPFNSITVNDIRLSI
jgi:hypothetical protein